MTTFIPKTTSHFCHEWQRASNSSSHVIITGRVSILIIIEVTIIVLVLWSLWRRNGRLYKATKVSLSSCNTIDTGVHLTQLITECVKASIHALKLRHDCLEGHTTRRRRRSGCGWSRRGRTSCRLSLWPLQSKLGPTPSNGRRINDTYDKEVILLRIGDRKVVNDPRDSRRKDKLIMGRYIPIDIYKGEYEMRKKV